MINKSWSNYKKDLHILIKLSDPFNSKPSLSSRVVNFQMKGVEELISLKQRRSKKRNF
jgi:hypothetical protein